MAQKKSTKGQRTQKRTNNNRNSYNSSSAFGNAAAGNSVTAANGRMVTAFRRSPAMTVGRGGSLRIRNTERAASPTFTDNTVVAGVKSFNPCNASNFPWLSQIARNYGQYVVHAIKYSWIPRCSTATSSELQMAVMYDYADAAYYVASLSGANGLEQFGEFAYGTAWQGGPLASHDSMLMNVPTGWFGVLADTDKIHARVQRFLCNNSSASVSGENQIDACHLVYRTYVPASTTIPGGSIYVSYDIEFFHPTLSTANAGLALGLYTAERTDPGETCWRQDKTGKWVEVPCGPPPTPPVPSPLEESMSCVDDPWEEVSPAKAVSES